MRHALARGLDPIATMAELFGKSTGVSRGKGGSMHLFDAALHFMGGHAIVGGHLPLAAGLALSAQFKNTGAVAMAFLGDGSVNEGEFHETLNLAAVWNLPIVFVLENNLYGMGSSVERVHARGGNFDQASNPYGFDTVVVDGMDVIGMREKTAEAVSAARKGDGPAFIEAKTFRFHGHSLADPVNYRQKNEEEEWRRRDPIVTHGAELVRQGYATDDELAIIQATQDQVVQDAIQFALDSPEPETESLFEGIYADVPPGREVREDTDL